MSLAFWPTNTITPFHPISECRFKAGSVPFARCFRLWGQFVPMDDVQLAHIDFSDAIMKVRICEIMRLFQLSCIWLNEPSITIFCLCVKFK
jgi:hypothetical protein